MFLCSTISGFLKLIASLRQFILRTTQLMFTDIIVVSSLKSMCIPSFMSVSYMAVHVPIVMYGLRLFIVQELVSSELLASITSPSFACLHLQVFEKKS